MLHLRDLIIARIDSARQISIEQDNIINVYTPLTSIEIQFKVNRAILKFLSALKRYERQRSEREVEMLNEIKNLRFLSNQTIEQVFFSILKIFASYDPSFSSFGQVEKPPTDKLKALILAFFQKYQAKINSKIVFKMISHHIAESTPYLLLGWVSEWSRAYFSEQIQKGIEKESIRHEQQMKRFNNCRSSSFVKEKSTPFSNSTSLPRADPIIEAIFTNKQSVYGLFLDELLQHYKLLPLQLDISFLKSMRKLHSKRELEDDENLKRAAEVLIESKNKHTREQINQFYSECQQYLQKCPNALVKQKISHKKQRKKNLSLSPQAEGSKKSLKKQLPQHKFFERIKSESKEEDLLLSDQKQSRNSFLLHPKTNLISFQSSQLIMQKFKQEKAQKHFQLPIIAQSNRILSENVRSSMFKNRQMNAFYIPINRSMISNYQRGLLKNFVVSSKKSEIKTISVEKREEQLRNSQQTMPQIQQKPILSKRQVGDKRKRKLMLQLLREKNKRAFLDS